MQCQVLGTAVLRLTDIGVCFLQVLAYVKFQAQVYNSLQMHSASAYMSSCTLAYRYRQTSTYKYRCKSILHVHGACQPTDTGMYVIL